MFTKLRCELLHAWSTRAEETGSRLSLVAEETKLLIAFPDEALAAFHMAHGAMATMTAFPLRSQYGLVYADDAGRVTHFDEKPVLPDRLINAGFFVFDQSVFQAWEGSNLERDVLPALAQRDQLYIYRHSGFWRSMDTHKDQQELTGLWRDFEKRYAASAADSNADVEAMAAGGAS